MIEAFLEDLRRLFASEAEAFHRRTLPARPASTAPPPPRLHPGLAAALQDAGLGALWTHQRAALDSVFDGRHTAVVTPTASGKTLVYNLPVFQQVLADPEARALYLFPIKALEQDQRKAAEALAARLPGPLRPSAAVYDGDTPDHRRRRIRRSPPHILITNPDMVHRSLLPYHTSWKAFFENLRFVVLDELHIYKGVFGSHVAQVLRRLGRLARRYGSDPQWIACSATVRNPAEHARALTGLDFAVVDRHGAPSAARHFVFLHPGSLSAYTAAARIFTHAVSSGLRTIAFTKARKITELLFTWARRALPGLGDRLSSYRAGFLPSERREVERALASGELLGVVSTSALEMGIDIGGLDVCVLVGYPGTIIDTWQRSGRVGRGGRESAVVLVALPDALDGYFMRHPEEFFRRGFEAVTIDPWNPQILGPHLECAAAEAPLALRDDGFDLEAGAEAVRRMERGRRLLRSADGSRLFAARLRPQRFVDIRSIGRSFTIFEKGSRTVIGSVSGHRAFAEGHEGAVYLHRGRQYLVTDFDPEKGEILAERSDAPYYTRTVSEKETEVLEVLRRRPAGHFLLNLGRVKVTERIQGFEKRHQSSQELLSHQPLSLPPLVFETVGLWFAFPPDMEGALASEGFHFMGALHALEHTVIAVFPLFTLCDRFDLGGIATTHHPQVEGPAVFLYDGHPGGVGLCRRGFDLAEDILLRALDVVSACPCEAGCPSCVHSPKCGSGNKPLDKGGAAALLAFMLERRSLPSASPPARPAPPEPAPRPSLRANDPWGGRRVVVFDLETQRSAREVGGWHNASLMRVSVGVAWDSAAGAFRSFFEKDVEDLVALLEQADLVAGFNNVRFDNEVLSGYVERERLARLPTFDILRYIHQTYEFRIGLGRLAEQTLGRPKTADGLQALRWWKEKRLDLLEAYCRADVEITRDLLLFGMREGHLLYERKGERVRLPVEWDPASMAGPG